MVDEHDHIYFGSSTNLYRDILDTEDCNSTWFKIDFTPSLYQDKVYIKRVKFIEAPVTNIKRTLQNMENDLHNKKIYHTDTFTDNDAKQLEYVGTLLDNRYKD